MTDNDDVTVDPPVTSEQPAAAPQPAVPVSQPAAQPRWRDRVWSFRAMIAVAVASLIIGGLGGGLVAGIGLYRPVLSLTFGIVVAALALFADWLGLVAEEVLHPRGL